MREGRAWGGMSGFIFAVATAVPATGYHDTTVTPQLQLDPGCRQPGVTSYTVQFILTFPFFIC